MDASLIECEMSSTKYRKTLGASCLPLATGLTVNRIAGVAIVVIVVVVSVVAAVVVVIVQLCT